jgi:hypothetical protein
VPVKEPLEISDALVHVKELLELGGVPDVVRVGLGGGDGEELEEAFLFLAWRPVDEELRKRRRTVGLAQRFG